MAIFSKSELAGVTDWIALRRGETLFLFAGLVIMCSAFVTDLLIGDHAFRNTLVQSFPSYRTAMEGRWGHDIVIFLAGRSGNAAFQNLAALFLLALNGVLFGALAGVSEKWPRRFVAALVASCPLFLDYLSFHIDAISYTVGDTLILFGFLMLTARSQIATALGLAIARRSTLRLRAAQGTLAVTALAAVLFLFALAIYPPKISLLGVLLVMHLVISLCDPAKRGQNLIALSWPPIVAAGLAAVGYWISYQLIEILVPRYRLGRTNLNELSDMTNALMAAHAKVILTLASYAAAMPLFVTITMSILLVLAVVAIIRVSLQSGVIKAAAVGVLVLLVLPVALEFSAIVNALAVVSGGARVFAGYGFILAFLAVFAFRTHAMLTGILAVILIHGGGVVLLQENTAVAMKSHHDASAIMRIVERIEPLIETEGDDAIFVHGELAFDSSPFVASAARPFRPHFTGPSLTHWNYPEVVNFFLVGAKLRDATIEEKEAALKLIASRKSWPAQAAVFRMDNVIVVYLADR